jgi:hypothetical protein
MFIRTQKEHLQKALDQTNSLWHDNIYFDQLEPRGSGFLVRLKTNTYSRPGYRRTFSGRKNPHACWHVWGWFLTYLGKIDPAARYKNHRDQMEYVYNHGWEDWNIGNQSHLLAFSQACDCPVVDKTTETSNTIRITKASTDWEKTLIGPEWEVLFHEEDGVWINAPTPDKVTYFPFDQVEFVLKDLANFGEQKYNLVE